MDAQKLLLLLALVLLLRPGDSQQEHTFSGGPSFRTETVPGTANERRRSTLGSARTVVNVKDFGARGDGSSDDTKAFAAAWKAACSSSAPVTVLVPEGKAYRLKPITFSGPCKSPITVAIKGTILASGRMSDWDGADRRLWMLFDKVDGLRVEGGGTIDGNGQVWWKVSCKVDSAQKSAVAVSGVTFQNVRDDRTVPCRGITLQDVRLVTASGAPAKSFCRNVSLSKYGTVVPSTCSS
ncbi:unnamed protein product [Spirodela intermedia]|uniref:Uncharacterized protein n=1 Tax=Spirodela intermedia TaxID=51605 RepID=A0A7I8I838_SPIIN|nr:unnamed protein product [Spirodela intermedia]CAA6653634.1 unnamed protein product [Spirodela intermedia]